MDDFERFIVYPRLVKSYIERRMNSELSPLGLTSSSGPFVLAIRSNEGASLKDISARMLVDKSLSTRMARVLIEGGFAENVSPDPRTYSLRLTEKGETAAESITEIMRSIQSEIADGLDNREKEFFKHVLARIIANLRERNGDGGSPPEGDDEE